MDAREIVSLHSPRLLTEGKQYTVIQFREENVRTNDGIHLSPAFPNTERLISELQSTTLFTFHHGPWTRTWKKNVDQFMLRSGSQRDDFSSLETQLNLNPSNSNKAGP